MLQLYLSMWGEEYELVNLASDWLSVIRCFSTKLLDPEPMDLFWLAKNVRSPKLEMSYWQNGKCISYASFVTISIFHSPEKQSHELNLWACVRIMSIIVLWIRAWALSLSLFSISYLTFARTVSNSIQRLIQCSIQFNANGRVLKPNYYWNS